MDAWLQKLHNSICVTESLGVILCVCVCVCVCVCTVSHSKRDPDFIVAKLAKKSSVAEILDHSKPSPNTFILQTTDCFYIWIGSECKPTYQDVAKQTVRRVQRFENATPNAKIIHQGQETEDFWQHLKEVT